MNTAKLKNTMNPIMYKNKFEITNELIILSIVALLIAVSVMFLTELVIFPKG